MSSSQKTYLPAFGPYFGTEEISNPLSGSKNTRSQSAVATKAREIHLVRYSPRVGRSVPVVFERDIGISKLMVPCAKSSALAIFLTDLRPERTMGASRSCSIGSKSRYSFRCK